MEVASSFAARHLSRLLTLLLAALLVGVVAFVVTSLMSVFDGKLVADPVFLLVVPIALAIGAMILSFTSIFWVALVILSAMIVPIVVAYFVDKFVPNRVWRVIVAALVLGAQALAGVYVASQLG